MLDSIGHRIEGHKKIDKTMVIFFISKNNGK